MINQTPPEHPTSPPRGYVRTRGASFLDSEGLSEGLHDLLGGFARIQSKPHHLTHLVMVVVVVVVTVVVVALWYW